MFERYTDRCRRVIVLAQDEARALRNGYLGTEHILLGLISEGEAIPAQVLTERLPIDRARKLARRMGNAPMDGDVPTHIPFTSRSKKVIELGLRESLQLGHGYIAPEHLLLALIREGSGIGAEILVEAGFSLADLRQTVIGIATGATTTPWERVSVPLVLLEEAGAWFDRLETAVGPFGSDHPMRNLLSARRGVDGG